MYEQILVYDFILEEWSIPKKTKNSYEDLELLIDSFPGAMIITDKNGIILDLNEPLAIILLKPKKDLIGTPAIDHLEDHAAKSRFEILQKVVQKKKPITFVDYERKRWWKTTAIPLMDNKGDVVKVAGYIEDITEEKEKEKKRLLNTEEYYQTLIEQSVDLISIVDETGQIKYHSPSLKRMLGYDPKERKNRSMREHIHSDDIEKLQIIFKRSLAHPDHTINANFRVKHKDGGYRNIETIINNQIDNPLIQGLIIHARDVTDRERSRVEIQNQKRYLETLMNSTSEIIFTIDKQQKIGIWNKAAELNTGVKQKDIQGKTLKQAAIFDNISEIEEYITDIGLSKPAFLPQIVVKGQGYGKRLWDVSPSVVKRDGSPTELVFVCKDITFKDESHGKLIPGVSYIISDTILDPTRDLFKSLLKQQWNGFYISRSNERPEQVFTDIIPHFSVISSDRSNKDNISNLNDLYEKISSFIRENEKPVILLDRIDYLVSLFSFHDVLNTLYRIADIIKQKQGLLLLRVNKLLFTPEQYAFLQEEFNKLPSREIQHVHLRDDEYSILQYIYEQNQKNSLISQKHICNQYSISKVTSQKRLEELLGKGLIISKKQGRSKFLYATEKGKELLQRHSIL